MFEGLHRRRSHSSRDWMSKVKVMAKPSEGSDHILTASSHDRKRESEVSGRARKHLSPCQSFLNEEMLAV